MLKLTIKKIETCLLMEPMTDKYIGLLWFEDIQCIKPIKLVQTPAYMYSTKGTNTGSSNATSINPDLLTPIVFVCW